MQTNKSKILIVGAGATGLALALAFAKLGQKSVIVGKIDQRRTGRTVALFEGSVRFLRHLDLWNDIEPVAAPLQTMCIIDNTRSLFRPPPARFSAREIGLDQFGFNVESWQLLELLHRNISASPLIRFENNLVESYKFGADVADVKLDDGSLHRTELVVAADGLNSPARKAANIATKCWSYPQSALTCILSHTRPHNDTSTEFHTRQGPFTLVPLAGHADAPYRSSLVWLMEPERAEAMKNLSGTELECEIEQQAQSFLGRMSLETAAHVFPMCGMITKRLFADRLALIGEAAHGFPPIGAQGLNLGFRDVACLVDCLQEAFDRKQDVGDPSVLQAYDRSRQGDIAFRAGGVDVLNRSLLAPLLPFDFARGAVLLALSQVTPLRKLIMRTGLMPRGTPPSLMRAIA